MSTAHDQRLQVQETAAGNHEHEDVRIYEHESVRIRLAQAPTATAFLKGAELRFSYVNDLYVRTVGRSSCAELLGRTVYEALPQWRDSGIFALLEDVHRTGMARLQREFKLKIQPRGMGHAEERYLDLTLQPTFTSTGDVEGVVVLAVDATEDVQRRHQLEANEKRLGLSEQEQEFRSLANAMPQLVWMADADGYIRWFNEQWCAYTGTTAEQNAGWGWQSAHDPERLTDVMTRWTACLQSGEPFEMVFPLRGGDGTYKPFLTRAVPIRDGSGVITRWFGTNTDISSECQDRRQIEENQEIVRASLAATQKLAAIVESSDDSIISKDLDGIVRSWNPGAERVFGYTAEEMVGRSIRILIPRELLEEEDRIMSAVAHGQRTEHFETTRIRKDGDRIEVSLTLSPLYNESGEIVGVASISRDVSQQKKVEKALHTSERLATVGRLAATIAHEINNPLEAVTNLVYLAQSCMQDADGKMFLEQAQQELARMALLTKQTLGFYRENRGAQSLTLGELVTPLVGVFSARARNKQISIGTEIRQDPTLVGFPGELRQLFVNLLNNSIDAAPDHGRILVRVSAARESCGQKRAGVRLTVADNGSGIAPNVRKKLFEPFFTTKRDVGTGLGLWVTFNILRKHDGTIRVRSSVVPGKSWTVFSVFFPFRSESTVAAA